MNEHSKTITRIEIGDGNKSRCPYCNNVFSIENQRCPNCGAGIERVNGKIVVTKIEENKEAALLVENKHKENMEAYKNARHENLIMILAGFGFLLFMYFLVSRAL